MKLCCQGTDCSRRDECTMFIGNNDVACEQYINRVVVDYSTTTYEGESLCGNNSKDYKMMEEMTEVEDKDVSKSKAVKPISVILSCSTCDHFAVCRHAKSMRDFQEHMTQVLHCPDLLQDIVGTEISCKQYKEGNFRNHTVDTACTYHTGHTTF